MIKLTRSIRDGFKICYVLTSKTTGSVHARRLDRFAANFRHNVSFSAQILIAKRQEIVNHESCIGIRNLIGSFEHFKNNVCYPRSNRVRWKNTHKHPPSWKTTSWSKSRWRKSAQWTVSGRSIVAPADLCTIANVGKSMECKIRLGPTIKIDIYKNQYMNCNTRL